MTIRSNWLRDLIPVLAAFALAGCATTYPMMPTPALYTGPQAKPPFTDMHAEDRTPSLDLLFITDRAPARSADDPEPPAWPDGGAPGSASAPPARTARSKAAIIPRVKEKASERILVV